MIEQVRQAVDIVEVIDSVVPLKRSGSSWKACCPFHKEKTPSFHVSAARQSFKCFGCGAGGDVFKFVQLYENVDFPEAVRKLAARAGVALPERGDPGEGQRRDERRRLLSLHAEVGAYWRELLRHDRRAEPARRYMQQRDIPLTWANEFGLGYAPDAWDDTLQWARARSVPESLLLEAGLVVKNEQGRVYDRFRGRLVFPIANDQGETIAFSARLLDAEAKAAKYINSPETPLFTKSKVLFGWHRAKRAILDADRVVICEGQLDVLRCHAAGILNVVAPLGTAFTEEHARILRRATRNVILCLDADRAGMAAVERAAGVLAESGQNGLERLVASDLGIEVLRLPEGHDPDSFIRQQGAEAFRKLLEAPLDYLDFLVEVKLQQFAHEAGGRRKALEAVAAALAQVPNAASREQMMQKAAVRLGSSPAVLLEEIERLRRSARSRKNSHAGGAASSPVPKGSESAAPASPAWRCDVEVRECLILLLTRPDMAAEFQRQVDPAWLRDRAGFDLVEQTLELAQDGMLEGPESLAGRVRPEQLEVVRALPVALLEQKSVEELQCLIATMARKIRHRWIRDQLHIISRQMADPALDAEARRGLLARQMEMKNQLTNDLRQPTF